MRQKTNTAHDLLLLIKYLFFLAPLAWMLACAPPEHPEPEFPPCLAKTSPEVGSTLSLRPKFRLEFSKEIEPNSISVNTIFLARGVVDAPFVSDLESLPISTTRKELLVPLKISRKDYQYKGNKATVVTVEVQELLLGEVDYFLVLTKKIKDQLVEVTQGRFSGGRPLNRCVGANGIWQGDIASYKNGISLSLSFKTEKSLGEARIMEVMIQSAVGIRNGQFIEIMNISTKNKLNLRDLSIDNDSNSPRELLFLTGNPNLLIPPGGRAVIVEPDYPLRFDPYELKDLGIPILTTKGSSSTLLSGFSDIDPLILLKGKGKLVDIVLPQTVGSGGKWPRGKSLERCDANKKNDKNNWASAGKGIGSPGRKNQASCP